VKIIVDTNIVIDALTSREPWNKSAEKLFLLGANHIVDMYITANSATDIYYIIRKHLQNNQTAKQIMSKLFSLVGILDVTGMDCVEAVASPITDYEDAVLEKIAARENMEYIVTRNIRDYQKSVVKAILPDDFLRIITEE